MYLLHYGLANKKGKPTFTRRQASYSPLEIDYMNALRPITVAIVKTKGGIEVKRQPRLTIAGCSRKKQKLCTL